MLQAVGDRGRRFTVKRLRIRIFVIVTFKYDYTLHYNHVTVKRDFGAEILISGRKFRVKLEFFTYLLQIKGINYNTTTTFLYNSFISECHLAMEIHPTRI